MEGVSISLALFRVLIGLCTVVSAVLLGVFFAYLKSQSEVRRTCHAMFQLSQRSLAVLGSLPQAVIVFNQRGMIEDFNRAAETMFGCTARHVVGCDINSLRLFSLEDGTKPFNQESAASGEWPRVAVRAQARRIDGATFPVELAMSEACVDSGHLVVGVVRELKPAAEAPALAKAPEWPVLEAAGALVLVLDKDGRILRMNGTCRQLTGYQESEVAGSYFWDVLLDPETAALVRESFERQRPPELFRMTEREWRGKDGRRWRVALRLSAVSETGLFLLTGFDVTERVRQFQESLEETRMEALSHLAGEIGSRFHNWLTLVAGYGDLVRAGLAADDPVRADVDELRGAAGQAVELTRALQSFGGRRVLRPKLVDVNALAGEVAGVEPGWETKLAPGVGLVHVDPAGLRQAIETLMRQARAWSTEPGGLTVVSTEVSAGGGQPCVMLAVAAERARLPSGAARLFEPFGPALPELSETYGFLRQSGGDIHLAPRNGHGLRFEIYLPRTTE